MIAEHAGHILAVMKQRDAYHRIMKAMAQMERETASVISIGGKSFAEAVLRSCRIFSGDDGIAVIYRQKDSTREVLTLDVSDMTVFAAGADADKEPFLDCKKVNCVERNDGSIISGEYRTWMTIPVLARKETMLSIVIARRKGRFHGSEMKGACLLGAFYTDVLHGVRLRNKKIKTLTDDTRHGILLNTQASISRSRVEREGYAAAVDYGAGIGSDVAKAYAQPDGGILLSTFDVTADNAERQAGLIYLDAWLAILSQTSLDAAGILNRLNADMFRRKTECYSSISLVRYMPDKQRIEIAGCGNISTLCFCHETMETKILDFGPAVGVTRDFNVMVHGIPVKCGDIVCSFTDGISGTRKRNGELFGNAAVGDIIKKHCYLSTEELAGKIISAVRDKGENGVNLDDRTVQILKIV